MCAHTHSLFTLLVCCTLHFHYNIATILLCALAFLLFLVISRIDYINHLQYTSGLYWWNVSIAVFMQHFIASENLVLINNFFDLVLLVQESFQVVNGLGKPPLAY